MKLIDQLLQKSNLSPNRQKVFQNVCWAVLGKVVNIICGLLVGILVARYLGPENFGLMNYVISYVTLFSILASFGLDSIEVRELSKSGAAEETIMGSAFAIRLIFAVMTVLLILITLWRFESDAFTFSMVMVYSLSLIFSALNIIRNYFTAIMLNEYVVKTEISRALIGSGIKVLLLLNQCSLSWFVVASTLDFALVGSGYLYSYRKNGGVIRAWHVDVSTVRMLLWESFPLLLSVTAAVVYQKINVVMIRNMMDDASVGQFSVAERITELAVFAPIMIAQTVTPLMVQAQQDDPERYAQKRQQFMDVMVWGSIVVALAMFVLAAPTIRILFGLNYVSAIPALQIMVWKAVFSGLMTASGQLIIIQNIQHYAVVRNILGCVVCVTLNFLLIPVWGLAGSAVSAVLAVLCAGYFSHLFIGAYRPLFFIQTRAIFLGWKQLLHVSARFHAR